MVTTPPVLLLVTRSTSSQLYNALAGIWGVVELLDNVREMKDRLEDMLQNQVPTWRSELLAKLSEASQVRATATPTPCHAF